MVIEGDIWSGYLFVTDKSEGQSFSVTKKSRGRPPGRTKPETATVRVRVDLLQAVDLWIAERLDNRLSRSDVVGTAIEDWLKARDGLDLEAQPDE